MYEDSLSLFHPKAPKVTQTEVDNFVSMIAGYDDWIRARDLTPRTGCGERLLRAFAHASDGKVITGQLGYKSTAKASVAEVNHAAAWLESQARAMERRASAIRGESIRKLEFQMDLFQGEGQNPLPREVTDFIRMLNKLPDWRTARDLTVATGHTDRKLRHLAHLSNGKIITGQLGYKSTEKADEDEIRHASAWLSSQARSMMARAEAIIREALLLN